MLGSTGDDFVLSGPNYIYVMRFLRLLFRPIIPSPHGIAIPIGHRDRIVSRAGALAAVAWHVHRLRSAGAARSTGIGVRAGAVPTIFARSDVAAARDGV